MMNKSQKYLTYTQVSEYLNLPIGTVYYLVHKKSIPHVRLGKKLVRFDISEIQSWIDTSKQV